MHLLYISPVEIDLNRLDGVQKKILDQSKAFCRHGLKVTIISHNLGLVNLIDIDNTVCKSKSIGKGASKFAILAHAKKIISDYDVFYIRYPKSDPIFLSLLREIKNQNKKVVVEIPTFPYDNQGRDTIKGEIISLIDRIFRRFLSRYVDRIVTFTGEKEIFGIKTINTINGFDFCNVNCDTTSLDTQKEIRLIAVSAMFLLHGYDRLIKGLANYYKSGGNRNVSLHLVGSGDYLAVYQKLAKDNELLDHVFFHGKVFGEHLYNLYKGSAFGVNSLAIHRENLLKESTLKTKEYAAMGLPIISSSYVDALSEQGNKSFAYIVPADESDIDIDGIISFADKLYFNKLTEEVRTMVREDGRSICDILVTTKPIYDYYVNNK